MERFIFRAWDLREKVMIAHEEIMKDFAKFTAEHRYVLMQSAQSYDQKGTLLFEGDFIAYVNHLVDNVPSYEIEELIYNDQYMFLGERTVKRRISYHDRWQNESHYPDLISTLNPRILQDRYIKIGNKYENPNCVDEFRINPMEMCEQTAFVDKNGNSIYEYHVLFLPNGTHRVVQRNRKYSSHLNEGDFYLRRYEDRWKHGREYDLLTQEVASQCEITTHTFLDEKVAILDF